MICEWCKEEIKNKKVEDKHYTFCSNRCLASWRLYSISENKYIIDWNNISIISTDYLYKKLCNKKYTRNTKTKSFRAEVRTGTEIRQKRFILSNKNRYRHPLKPWKDPESLFCSPKLKEIIGKEPLKGDECKDDDKRTNKLRTG